MHSCVVRIDRLEVYAHVGVSGEERRLGHRLELDVEAEFQSTAFESDEVASTVDYSALARLVADVVSGARVKTLERLSLMVAEQVLGTFPQVDRLRLSIRKPCPPAPMIAASMGIRVAYTREDLGPNAAGGAR